MAPHGAPLLAPDACGNLPQKKTRNPAPDQGCSRRGRREPQNRDGSRDSGFAEGSLPRLAPGGQRFGQEIHLLRSLIDRLSSRRPLNHTYISRYMRLLIQAIAADARIPRQLTDQQEVDALIKKVFHKTVDEDRISFNDLLPVRKARPGDKWWPWRDLVPLRTRREYGLIDPGDPWPHEDEEYFATMDALEEVESSYLDDLFDDDLHDDSGVFTDDPDDPDPFPSDPDYDHLPPPDQDEEPSDPTLVITGSEQAADVSDAPWREPIPCGEAGGPTPSPLMGEGWGEGDPFPDDHLPPPDQPEEPSVPTEDPNDVEDSPGGESIPGVGSLTLSSVEGSSGGWPHPAPPKTALIPTESTRPP